MQFSGQRVVITGGSSGIGLTMARAFADQGATVVVYSASKAFLHSYTQSLRAQLAGTSVRVVELLPPVVDTPMAAELDPSFSKMPPEKLVSAFLQGLSRGRNEIAPGQSTQLKWLSRFAPRLIFGQLNKNPRGQAA